MEENNTSDSKERERVHIFVPKDDKKEIDKAAAKYYSDNRSGFLRVVASFYTEFLRNGLTTNLKKLRQDIVEILERIKEIESTLKEISDQIKDNTREVPDR